ncbi:TRAP transporter substrate-binding protein [Tistrella bauzanensis]|uniref:TRAP transporter substrate-binding protein n=1 Tax=Tistrella TaxID=171436 RepID=UPI0031F63F5F
MSPSMHKRLPGLRARILGGAAAAALTLAAAGAANAADVTIRLGHYFATEDFRGRTAQHFADRVEALSDSIDVEVFPAESLVKGREGLQATAQGTVDMYSIYAGYVTGQAKLLNIFTLPFPPAGYTDEAQAKFAADPAVRDVIDRSLGRFNVRMLGVINSSGDVGIFLREPVNDIGDLNGRKLRGAGGLSDEALRALGGSVVFMSAAEQFLALQTGTVDGIATTWSSYVNNNLASVAPTHLDANLVRSPYLLIMNGRKWQSLDADQQKAIEQAVTETIAWSTENFKAEQDKLYAEIKKQAKVSVPLSAEDRAKVDEMVKPIYQGFVDDNGEDGAKLMELWKRYAGAS